MREIHLYGHLGKMFGTLHKADVDTLGEAMWFLDVNFGGFFDAAKKGHYELYHGIDPLSLDEVNMTVGKKPFHIIPVAEGSGGDSGKGIMTAVIGVALVATAFIGAAAAGAGGIIAGMSETAFMGITWGTIGLVGVSLTLAGVSSLLAGTPTVDSYENRNEDEKVSFLFSGPVNRVEQGVCLPLVFGEFTCGSILASGGITIKSIEEGGSSGSDDETVDPTDPTKVLVALMCEEAYRPYFSTSKTFDSVESVVKDIGVYTFTVTTGHCAAGSLYPWLSNCEYQVWSDGQKVDSWKEAVTNRTVSLSGFTKNTFVSLVFSPDNTSGQDDDWDGPDPFP